MTAAVAVVTLGRVTVLPLPAHGRWANDLRGEGRAVRVSAHAEAGLVTVSLWKAGSCVGAVRLAPGEAAELVAGLSEGLAHLADAAHPAAGQAAVPASDTVPSADAASRLRDLERRVAELEARPPA